MPRRLRPIPATRGSPQPPEAVVFPRRAEDVAAVLKFANASARFPSRRAGRGRGYVGGCVPKRGGIVVSFARMNRVLEINPVDGVAVVQPGVITGEFQAAAWKLGLCYPPDPASLKECSLGGNVATNAGGPRCLKYGVTRNYVLGLQVALADGTLVRVGGRTVKNKSGFDLVGIFVGAEGLLGLVTEITLRLLPAPPARAVLSASFPDARHRRRLRAAHLCRGLPPLRARAGRPLHPPGRARASRRRTSAQGPTRTCSSKSTASPPR